MANILSHWLPEFGLDLVAISDHIDRAIDNGLSAHFRYLEYIALVQFEESNSVHPLLLQDLRRFQIVLLLLPPVQRANWKNSKKNSITINQGIKKKICSSENP